MITNEMLALALARPLDYAVFMGTVDGADARARTAGRVYSVRRHRRAVMLELAVGWAR